MNLIVYMSARILLKHKKILPDFFYQEVLFLFSIVNYLAASNQAFRLNQETISVLIVHKIHVTGNHKRNLKGQCVIKYTDIKSGAFLDFL